MRRHTFYALTLSLAACAACRSKSGGDTGMGDGGGASGDNSHLRDLSSGSYTFSHDGRRRSFELYLPDGLAEGAPLVVAFHGYGGSATYIQGYAQLDRLADTEGFAVLYPQSTTDRWDWNCWNVGYCNNNRVDDVGFVRAVMALVQNDQRLGQVIVTGMSNGGDMTYRMACEASDVVSVAVPVAGCLMGWLADACVPADPVPMLHIHGNADDITMWDGDPTYTGGGYYSTLDSIGFIADLHRATDYSTAPLEGGSDSTVHSWARSGEVPVQLYEIDGGGHTWPTGGAQHDVDVAVVMWDFFRQYAE